MNATRLPATALFASAAALAVCGATALTWPLSAGSAPSGIGPVGPAAVSSPVLSKPSLGGLIRSAEGTVGRTAADPIGTTDRITDQALTTVRTVRNGALTTVGSTVNATLGTATRTVSSALNTVGQVETTALRTVGSVGIVATSTVGDVERVALSRVATTLDVTKTTVGQVTTLAVTLTKIGASADVDALQGTGTITVSDGDLVLATAELDHGKATVTLTGPVTHLTIGYGGDALLAPSATVL